MPLVRGEKGETEEGSIVELEVPFDTLPAPGGIPPVTGKREGAVDLGDGAAMGAGEERKGMLMPAAPFGGDMDFQRRAKAFERKRRLREERGVTRIGGTGCGRGFAS